VPNYEKFSRVERVVISVPYYKKRAYWDFLKAQIGKPYDKLAIVAFAVNRGWREIDAWFCDELVTATNMRRSCASWRRRSTDDAVTGQRVELGCLGIDNDFTHSRKPCVQACVLAKSV
jgi:hypothetical protein